MEKDYNQLVKLLLDPKGLSLIYNPILRIKDIQGAFRRAIIILFTYMPTRSTAYDSNIQGFTLSSWLQDFSLEISDNDGIANVMTFASPYNFNDSLSLRNLPSDYQNKTTLELLHFCTDLDSTDLLNIIKDIYDKYGFTVDEFNENYNKAPFHISGRKLDSMRKIFASDLSFLSGDNRWLKIIFRRENINYYQRNKIADLPIFDSNQVESNDNLSYYQWQILLEYVEILYRIEPEFTKIADRLSEHQIIDHRVNIHLDYVVPEAYESNVENIHQFLRDIWYREDIPLVSFQYESSSSDLVLDCLVYPVCIYYFQRAKYLCAFGYKSNRGITWHNYRLDRIQPDSYEEVHWESELVPTELFREYKNKHLYSPSEIQNMMEDAWGFDFYQKSATLILRFDRVFHDKFIANTFRHETFEQIPNIKSVEKLLTTTVQDPKLVASLKSRLNLHPQDAYYQAQVRLNDNNIIMRLRAWGDKVEVLAPDSIRQRMLTDIQNTVAMYSK
jgi:CRISPR-associated protein (TIGR03985 family)